MYVRMYGNGLETIYVGVHYLKTTTLNIYYEIVRFERTHAPLLKFRLPEEVTLINLL